MTIVICPGIHAPELTQSFVTELKAAATETSSLNQSYSSALAKILVFPADQQPPYSGFHILHFVQQRCDAAEPLLFLGFSAGVVGAIGAAWSWQSLGKKVKAVIALDGWGVALYGGFPVHRVSHDYFTHWSSSLLGAGESRFYAEPAIAHLHLWQYPHTISGWEITAQGQRRITLTQFLLKLLKTYGEQL